MFYRHISYKGRALNPIIAEALELITVAAMVAALVNLYLTAAWFCN